MAEIETILTLEEPDIRFRHIKKIAHVARGSLFEILMIVDDDHCDYRVCISKDGEYCCQIIDPMQSRDVEPGSPEELARVDKFLSEAISDIDQNDLRMF